MGRLFTLGWVAELLLWVCIWLCMKLVVGSEQTWVQVVAAFSSGFLFRWYGDLRKAGQIE